MTSFLKKITALFNSSQTISPLSDQKRIRKIILSYVDSCGPAGADFASIDKHVLSELAAQAELSQSNRYKKYFRAIRNKLRKANMLYYDENNKVWKIYKSTRIESDLTPKEKIYLQSQGLVGNWVRIKDPLCPVDWLYKNLNPEQFEFFCISLLSKHCKVPVKMTQKHPVSGADGGFDGLGEMEIDGVVRPVAIQVKRYALNRQVGSDHFDHFGGAMTREDINHGFMITTGLFSAKSKEYIEKYRARGILIEAVDQNRLMDIMLVKTSEPYGYGVHRTELGILYMNEDILRVAGNLPKKSIGN